MIEDVHDRKKNLVEKIMRSSTKYIYLGGSDYQLVNDRIIVHGFNTQMVDHRD